MEEEHADDAVPRTVELEEIDQSVLIKHDQRELIAGNVVNTYN